MLVVGNQHGRVNGTSRVALLLLLPVRRVNIWHLLLLLRLLVSNCLLLLPYLLLTGRRYPSQPTPRPRRGTGLISMYGCSYSTLFPRRCKLRRTLASIRRCLCLSPLSD